MTSVLLKCATKILCENQGGMDVQLLAQVIEKYFTVDAKDLLAILSNDGTFAMKEGKEKASALGVSPDSIIVAKTALRVCQSLPGKCIGCDNLHLCRYYVCGSCRFGNKCKNDHKLHSPHNMKLLERDGLQDLREDELFQLLIQNDPYLLPEVCSHYNKGEGTCKFSSTCSKLHLCLHYLREDCKFGPACKRAHALDDMATKILTGRGLSSGNIRNLVKLYRNKFIIADHVPLDIAALASAAPRVVSQRTHTPSAPSSSPVSDAERNEICLFFIRSHCSFKEKCVRVHYHLPYKWQVLDTDNVTWKDLPDMEVIEKAYCDAANSTSNPAEEQDLTRLTARVTDFLSLLNLRRPAPGDGNPSVQFLTMSADGRQVRRLSTASSVSKPPHFVLTTQWLWYWKDELGQWQQYGQELGVKERSTITSETIERVYLADTETEIPFKAGNHGYVLYLRDMYQQNNQYRTKREVRRRPAFVSAQDVEACRKSKSPDVSGSSPSSSSLVPSHWDKRPEFLPAFSYKLVPLSSSTKEYKKLEALFSRTMSGSIIHSIQRNQNSSLWRVFNWQKEQMKARNGGKGVDERYLFHGTDEAAVEAICEQNLDWRECGLNGTLYGMGSYFARDAKYSHAYAKSRTSRRKMLVALVLVGEFVKGSGSYRKPPTKGSSQTRYDCCVDRVDNPSIFVVFEKQQIYPEYLIDYS